MRFMVHRHTWWLVEKETHPSGWEQLTAEGRRAGKLDAEGMDLFKRDVIAHFRCACGAEKVERI